MDSKQIDHAMKNKLPVICAGKRYDYIEEYVMYYKDGKRKLSVGLRQGRCLVRVPADKVELEEV